MAISRQHYQQFLWAWLAALVMFLCTTAALNYLVDPYGLFDSERIEGFNAIKPTAANHVRMAKPYQIISFLPKTVIAGNSRTEMGLDPLNDCWSEEQRPVFNIGLPGASIYIQTRTLQHATLENDSKLVLWGLDFLDFLGAQKGGSDPNHWPVRKAAFEDRLRVNADGSENFSFVWKRLEDQLGALFSLDTLKDSFHTLLKQKNHRTSSIRRDGFNPAFDYLDIITWEGQGVLFQQKNQNLARRFTRPGLKLYQEDTQWSKDFENVRRFLLFAKKNEMRVVLFINPYHADYLSLLELTGLWPMFEAWKLQLTDIADTFEVELWDFSGINALSIEQAPVLGDKTSTLQWFWEPAHYKKEYGDLMLSRMLKLRCDSGGAGPVGIQLTKQNINKHIARSSRYMTDYKTSYSDVFDRLQRLLPDAGQVPEFIH